MDDVLYRAPRGGKLHFAHCRDLKHKGSDFRSWEQVSAASVDPSDSRLCMWCRRDLLTRRAELERASGSSESLSEKRSPEDLLRLAEEAVVVARQVIELVEHVGPPLKRGILATADSVRRARAQLQARKARRAEQSRREIKPAVPPSSTYDVDADSEEIADADVIDTADGHSNERPLAE